MHDPVRGSFECHRRRCAASVKCRVTSVVIPYLARAVRASKTLVVEFQVRLLGLQGNAIKIAGSTCTLF